MNKKNVDRHYYYVYGIKFSNAVNEKIMQISIHEYSIYSNDPLPRYHVNCESCSKESSLLLGRPWSLQAKCHEHEVSLWITQSYSWFIVHMNADAVYNLVK